MPGTFEFGEIPYTLSDFVVAAYNPTADTYGSPASVAGGQLLEVEPETDTDKLRAYGAYVRGLAVHIGAKLTWSAGGVDFSVAAIISGVSNQTSGADPNQVRTMDLRAGGSGMGRFGVLGMAVTDDGGLFIVGLRNCLLDKFSKWSLDGKTNKFFTGDVPGYAFAVGGQLMRSKQHQTASGFTVPADGTAFKAFFTAPAMP